VHHAAPLVAGGPGVVGAQHLDVARIGDDVEPGGGAAFGRQQVLAGSGQLHHPADAGRGSQVVAHGGGDRGAGDDELLDAPEDVGGGQAPPAAFGQQGEDHRQEQDEEPGAEEAHGLQDPVREPGQVGAAHHHAGEAEPLHDVALDGGVDVPARSHQQERRARPQTGPPVRPQRRRALHLAPFTGPAQKARPRRPGAHRHDAPRRRTEPLDARAERPTGPLRGEDVGLAHERHGGEVGEAPERRRIEPGGTEAPAVELQLAAGHRQDLGQPLRPPPVEAVGGEAIEIVERLDPIVPWCPIVPWGRRQSHRSLGASGSSEQPAATISAGPRL
jgi:hypothetical protein